jgi:hypothetical protein
MRPILGLCVLALLSVHVLRAHAQTAPPQPPPAPGAYPPPTQYPPPYPYGYPAYAPPPALPDQPKSLPYDGGEVRPGYHVEERVRRGPLIAGPIVFGVPYVLGLTIASEYDFRNQSGWLVVPVVGPFITAATRKKDCVSTYESSDTPDGECQEEGGMRTVLIMDGLAQATGAILMLWGLTSPVKVQIRNDVAKVNVAPTKVGTGYGVAAIGTF